MKHTNEEISPRLVEAVRDWWQNWPLVEANSRKHLFGKALRDQTLKSIANYPLIASASTISHKKDLFITYATDHTLRLGWRNNVHKAPLLSHDYGGIQKCRSRCFPGVEVAAVAVFLPVSHYLSSFDDTNILFLYPERIDGDFAREFGFILPRPTWGVDAQSIDYGDLTQKAFAWKRDVWRAAGIPEEHIKSHWLKWEVL